MKKDNLILNVDGTMAAVLVDIGFPVDSLNGFFILSRTIGLIGHWVDQKRQDSRLIRLFGLLGELCGAETSGGSAIKVSAD